MNNEVKNEPAFPCSYVGEDAPHEGIGGGLTIRDYFIAHAPAEPQEWFEPEIANPCPKMPEFPQGQREFFKEFHDVMKIEDAENETERRYISECRPAQMAISEWSREHEKQRHIQWPAAWADAMLAQRAKGE